MPHLIAVVLIGAGIVAGVKWIAREVARATTGDASHEQMVSNDPLAIAPKDLGALVWDADAGVYRPARRASGPFA
jgi:hypothetical protein